MTFKGHLQPGIFENHGVFCRSRMITYLMDCQYSLEHLKDRCTTFALSKISKSEKYQTCDFCPHFV